MRLSRPVPALLALLWLLPNVGRAHPVVVDGQATEWSPRFPNFPNLGLVARAADGSGELIWRDADVDARTDIQAPEVIAEVTAVQITGSPTGLGILVRGVPGAVTVGQPIQVQVAVDVDQVDGSGQNFMAGFSDTLVGNNARWEFLIQTLFGSGGQAHVLDGSFNTVAMAQAAQGPGGVELFVPWVALGLTAPPTTPLRLSVATFRATSNDLTVDIGGPNVSNALDAVTDYGDPRAAAYPNTFMEVQDQTLDDFVDVFFSANGEVYAPLLVQRFVANAAPGGAGEWFRVVNVSPVTLRLDAHKLGDEETPDGTEGMLRFPVGSTLAPGATFTVAANAGTFQAALGSAPDAELAATLVAVPKMTAFPLWAAGTLGLANAGDELLVLDGTNTILDVVVYGTGVYAGVTSKTPAPGAGLVLTRSPAHGDTDDCQVDFSITSQCANDAACGSACIGCFGFACSPRPPGAACDDATACNGAETCDGAGTCLPGTPPNCDDSNACTTDSCDPAVGCMSNALPPGTACDDATVCNGSETCNAAGECVAGAPLDCGDANPCTVESCDPVNGCLVTPAMPGTDCDDGDPCNGAASCDGSGNCAAGPAPNCDDLNVCTMDACVPFMGCMSSALQPGTPCLDGNACNGAEACNAAGTCEGGSALNCVDTNPCTADQCDPVLGCVNNPLPVGTDCSTDPMCPGMTCQMDGTCGGGSCAGSSSGPSSSGSSSTSNASSAALSSSAAGTSSAPGSSSAAGSSSVMMASSGGPGSSAGSGSSAAQNSSGTVVSSSSAAATSTATSSATGSSGAATSGMVGSSGVAPSSSLLASSSVMASSAGSTSQGASSSQSGGGSSGVGTTSSGGVMASSAGGGENPDDGGGCTCQAQGTDPSGLLAFGVALAALFTRRRPRRG